MLNAKYRNLVKSPSGEAALHTKIDLDIIQNLNNNNPAIELIVTVMFKIAAIGETKMYC